PFIRKILIKRTESLSPGESIEIIGKHDEEIASIASEPIGANTNGTLLADITKRDSGIHLKITLQPDDEYKSIYRGPETGFSDEHLDIDTLTTKLNNEIRNNLPITGYGEAASKLLKIMKKVERLKKNPKDKKTIELVYKSSVSLSSLSKEYGFVKISQLAENFALLFAAYARNGEVDKASIPVLLKTVAMFEKMIDGSSGVDVNSLISKISRV
ncbi:MAG: hypothetical protein ABIG39_04215, partial [Candidatus Micrarchaeota archaeon]